MINVTLLSLSINYVQKFSMSLLRNGTKECQLIIYSYYQFGIEVSENFIE